MLISKIDLFIPMVQKPFVVLRYKGKLGDDGAIDYRGHSLSLMCHRVC